MIRSKHEYLQVLRRELKNVPNKEEIIQEIDVHLSEMLDDIREMEMVDERDAMETMLNRLGTPSDVALSYQEELDVTPRKMQWTFISINMLFFIGGICLTIVYNVMPVPLIGTVWTALTSITSLLILLYILFWMLLGYEIGKEFGLGGKKLLWRTFYFALVPNLLLMGLVVFRLLPFSWFDPLLTPSFITICIVCTLFLYPISYAAFRWGTMRSI